MNAALQSQLDRVESSLNTLIDSITTYNPSVPAAIDLLSADDELTKGLEQRKPAFIPPPALPRPSSITPIRSSTALSPPPTNPTLPLPSGNPPSQPRPPPNPPHNRHHPRRPAQNHPNPPRRHARRPPRHPGHPRRARRARRAVQRAPGVREAHQQVHRAAHSPPITTTRAGATTAAVTTAFR